MSTATTAKIISQAGKANPPSLVALYGGTLGERKAAITEIENDLQAVGLNIIEFNARRYLSENDLCLPLVQQIVTELKGNSGSNGTTSDLVNRINESAPVILSTNLSSENRVEMIHQFDSSMKKLAAISIEKKPLIITLQGIERAVSGSFTKLSEFISNYININGFMFIISIGTEHLEKELLEANVNISSEDFLEDTFDFVANFSTEANVPAKQEKKSEDFFKPPAGLEVESGAAIAARRKGRRIPSAPAKKSSSGFKVRELAGKKATIKKAKPKRKIIRKVGTQNKAVKFKPVSANKSAQFLKSVRASDIFAAKKFWSKANDLSYDEFTDVVNSILKEASNNDSRVRATAITGLASIAKGVSWEMPSEVMDRALIMTGDGSKEVKDAAADAIKEMNAAGVEKSPGNSPSSTESTTTSGTMELSELDTDSMLGKTSGSVASMSIGSGTGGVKVMGGDQSSFGSAPTFKMTEDIPSMKKDNVPKFKPTGSKNTFKVVDEKKKVPKFKPTEKKKKNVFKVVD